MTEILGFGSVSPSPSESSNGSGSESSDNSCVSPGKDYVSYFRRRRERNRTEAQNLSHSLIESCSPVDWMMSQPDLGVSNGE